MQKSHKFGGKIKDKTLMDIQKLAGDVVYVEMYRMILCYLKNTGARRQRSLHHQCGTKMFVLLFSLFGLGSCVPFIGLGSLLPFGSPRESPIACVVHGTCYQGK